MFIFGLLLVTLTLVFLFVIIVITTNNFFFTAFLVIKSCFAIYTWIFLNTTMSEPQVRAYVFAEYLRPECQGPNNLWKNILLPSKMRVCAKFQPYTGHRKEGVINFSRFEKHPCKTFYSYRIEGMDQGRVIIVISQLVFELAI